MIFNIHISPYGEGKTLYPQETFEANPGAYILIGHNGAGKSTLLKEIESYCKHQNIPVFKYDNYSQGGVAAKEHYGSIGNLDSLATVAFSSEGEQIFHNFSNTAMSIGNFTSKNINKELVILLDALDSGLDIDGIEQIKELLKEIKKYTRNKAYIFITANNYALIHEQDCINVKDFKHYKFNDFVSYKEFIINQWEETRKNVL